jgi:F5/8 type C domain-containing protein
MNTTRKDLLKTGIALAYSSLLITSILNFAAVDSFGSKADARSTCQKLPIDDISASGETSGFPAENVIDSNLETRWHYEEIGAYIQTDLGELSTVCSVDIAWYKGDIGTFNYVISVSDNGKYFVDLVSGKSVGGTLYPERYNVPDANARYVRVTVYGNGANEWAAINEMSVNGQTVHENDMSAGSPNIRK